MTKPSALSYQSISKESGLWYDDFSQTTDEEGWSAEELGEQSTLIRQERGQIPTVILRIAGVYDEDCHSIPIAIKSIVESIGLGFKDADNEP